MTGPARLLLLIVGAVLVLSVASAQADQGSLSPRGTADEADYIDHWGPWVEQG